MRTGFPAALSCVALLASRACSAGPNGDHPWATHTFGAVLCDPKRAERIVACYPNHTRPARFTNALRHVWGKVKKHPTRTFRLAEKKGTDCACDSKHQALSSSAPTRTPTTSPCTASGRRNTG